MKSLMVVWVSLIAISAQAKKLTCDISLNIEKVYQTTLRTQPSEKVSIGRTHGISAYITEKSDSVFLIEAYLETENVRIYAEGPLKNPSEKISASLWSRESIVDITCSQL